VSVLDSLDLIETTAFHEGFLQAFLVIVRAANARGDTRRALSLLNRAERLGWERGWGRVVTSLLVERTRLHLQDGNLQEALSLLQAFDHLKAHHATSRQCSWTEIGTSSTIAKGLIASATGYTDDAVALLQEAYETLTSIQNRLDGMRVGLDLCVAHARAGSRTRCFTLLKELLEQAAPQGLFAAFLERGSTVGDLLLQADELALGDGNDVVRSFVDDLLGRMGLASPPQPETRKKPPAATRLTDREQAIIAFIATGNSNKEIARELGVAPETIKTHVKRIFHKLSAETRAQAVVRAQSLGMLGSSARALDTHQSSVS
jgi:LuxR family maltose regulon positive regulatory protein